MSDAKDEIILLHLHPLADETPVAIRLRFVLKRLLREEGFRCVRIEWKDAPPGWDQENHP